MKINIQYGLPFVELEVTFRGKKLRLDNVLLDTGSAGTIFNANVVEEIGVVPEKNDTVDTIRGVGGVEYVYVKNFDLIQFDEISQKDFEVEIGNMDYGMTIDGILGFDFISASKLVIDTDKMLVYTKSIIKKQFGDASVRFYTFIIALILIIIFGDNGFGIQGILLKIINAMLITISAMGGYEVLSDPMAKKMKVDR